MQYLNTKSLNKELPLSLIPWKGREAAKGHYKVPEHEVGTVLVHYVSFIYYIFYSIHLFIYLFMLCIHSLMHSLFYSFIHSFIYLLIYLFICLFTYFYLSI